MKLCGMNTHYRRYSLDYFLDSLKENGFTYMELWLAPQHVLIDYMGIHDKDGIVEKINNSGIKVVALCPEQNNPKVSNIASQDIEIQSRTLKYFENVMKLAQEINCRNIVITSGWGFRNEKKDEVRMRSIAMIQKLCILAQKYNCILVLENLQKFESDIGYDLKDIEQIVREVDHPSLKLTLDLGALLNEGYEIEDWFNKFGAITKHCHFIEDHAPFSSKEFMKDCYYKILESGYEGYFSLEIVDRDSYDSPLEVDKRMKEWIAE